MRIAYIGTARVPSRAANSIQLMKVADALCGIGHSVRVLLPGRPPQISKVDLIEHYGLRNQFEVVWLKEIQALKRYLFCFKAVMNARVWGADLIYTRALQAAAISSNLGHATILELHGPPTGRLGPALLRLSLSGRGFRRLIPTTGALAQSLQELVNNSLTGDQLVALPNGVDLKPYEGLGSAEEVRAELEWPQVFTAGYTGHLYGGRGAELMFELARRNEGIRFVWAGGSRESIEAWRERGRRRGLQNLNLLGFQSQQELPAIQCACDVLLAPYGASIAGSGGGDSAAYASPMKVVEYLAAGRVIMCTDLPVIGEILDEENAVLLPPDDLESWNSALLRLRDEPDTRARLSAAARLTAKGLTWESRQQRALKGIGQKK